MENKKKRPSRYVKVAQKQKPGPRPIEDATEKDTVCLRRSQWALIELYAEEGDDNPSANLRRALEHLGSFAPRGPRARLRTDKGTFIKTPKPAAPPRVVESEIEK